MSASTLPKLVSIVLLCALMAASVRAFLGTPPKRRARFVPLALAAAALAYAGAVVLGHTSDERAVAALLAAGGVLLSCLAGWYARAGDGGGGSGPEDEPPDEPPDDPVDWDRFERAFRDYVAERDREPAGSR